MGGGGVQQDLAGGVQVDRSHVCENLKDVSEISELDSVSNQ